MFFGNDVEADKCDLGDFDRLAFVDREASHRRMLLVFQFDVEASDARVGIAASA